MPVEIFVSKMPFWGWSISWHGDLGGVVFWIGLFYVNIRPSGAL